MADFVQVMKDWRRMCDTIQSENQEKQQSSWCKGCPLQETCIIDTAIKDSTINVFAIIGKQIEKWAEENPEPQYPTWEEWLVTNGVMGPDDVRMHKDYRFYFNGKPVKNIPTEKMFCHIPADIAEKLGLEPR